MQAFIKKAFRLGTQRNWRRQNFRHNQAVAHTFRVPDSLWLCGVALLRHWGNPLAESASDQCVNGADWFFGGLALRDFRNDCGLNQT